MSSVFTLIVLELGVLLVPVLLLREAEGLSRCLAEQKALSGSVKDWAGYCGPRIQCWGGGDKRIPGVPRPDNVADW